MAIADVRHLMAGPVPVVVAGAMMVLAPSGARAVMLLAVMPMVAFPMMGVVAAAMMVVVTLAVVTMSGMTMMVAGMTSVRMPSLAIAHYQRQETAVLSRVGG